MHLKFKFQVMLVCYNKEKPKRGHDGPKPVTAKCCRALLSSDKVDVPNIALSSSALKMDVAM